MAPKPTKKTSKRPPVAKTKAGRSRSKPLVASTAAVRHAKLAPAVAAPVVSHPVLLMFDMMGRVVAAYAEIPDRLARCRSPIDYWLIPAQVTQRLLSS
jgi:hypothetical protein